MKNGCSIDKFTKEVPRVFRCLSTHGLKTGDIYKRTTAQDGQNCMGHTKIDEWVKDSKETDGR